MSWNAILFSALLACLTGRALCSAQPPASPPASPARPSPPPPVFPMEFDFNDSTQLWANQSPIDEHSVSEWTGTGGRTGGGIHMRGTGGAADQMRVWKKMIVNPPSGRELHVTAWARGAGVENVVAVLARAHAATTQGVAGFASTQVDQPLKGDFDWTELKTTLSIPRGCANVQVILMLVGNGEVWFDDVRLELGAEANLIVPGVFEVRGEFTAASTDPQVSTATLLMPLPLDYRDQAPLGYELDVEPKERLQGARVYEDRPGNWVVELKLKNLSTSHDTKVHWSSAVLAAPTDFGAVPQSAPMTGEWPPEAREWLRSTRCVQSDDPSIRAIAKEIKGESNDVMAIIGGVLERARQIYAAQEGQCTQLDAVQALTKKGSCTSRANLTAALLRASGVPARILSGYPAWSGPLQTHYIVEAYLPAYGWYPIEPTKLLAGWPTHQQIMVSIVTPEQEDQSGPRGAAAGGVAYLSLTEHVPNEAPVRTLGTLGKPGTFCDHECRPAKNFAEETTPEKWRELLARSRARWGAWLKESGVSLATGGVTVERLRAASQDEIEQELIGAR